MLLSLASSASKRVCNILRRFLQHCIAGAYLFVICGIGYTLVLPTQLFLVLVFACVISPASYFMFLFVEFHLVDFGQFNLFA